ncbi:MAG TPA: hypothetical protein DCR43_03845 [Bacteroidales bacterium]|nr:MAG: hypothetical protein A2X11_00540 [Bacteroidetes bacterium GWE2_42_24]OFY27544.1 MAG: hypothetical protein A2X09_07685 [Bacteroidetes bacterium GWF2_43_11]HAQ64975.1 hypothetical protein [Bacteroidales bacterium]HBZ66068.1 hypothetical protein [Bacteroidales bacterium]
MKTLTTLLICILIATAQISYAQITLEKTYTGVSAGIAHTETYGDKYYVMDVANSQCRIYNLDHSLWKSVGLSVPSNYYLYDIQYVTEHLFNTDNSIEMLYVCYNYNSTLDYYTYETRIASETGTLLLTLPGAGYNWITDVAGAGTRLLSYVYNYAVSPYTVTTKVYSLAGSLSSEASDATGAIGLKAYPNPVNGNLRVEYTLPEGLRQAELSVVNTSGQIVRKYTVDHNFDSLTLDTKGLAPGTYFWHLQAPGFQGSSQQIIVAQ